MNKRAQVANQLSQMLSGSGKTEVLFSARVTVVDELTCTIDYNGLSLSDVRLLPTTDVADNMVLITPAIDSYVLVSSDAGDLSNLWVVRIETAEKIEALCDDVSVVIDNRGIVLNGGDLGGMVIVGSLVKKINAIEQSLNALKTVFNGWSPISQDGGAALKSAVSQWAAQPIIQTKVRDIENEKVKQ